MGLITAGSVIRTLTIWGIPLFEFIGLFLTLIFITYLVPGYIQILYRIWIGPAIGRGVKFIEMGKWAVVTGASDGIGKAFAEQLAERGLNIVLISRSKDKLEKVAKNIENNYLVETKIIVVDFTKGVEIYPEIEEELQGLEIGTLINNVGMAPVMPNYFLDTQSEKFMEDILFCNIFPVTLLTRIVLPQMVTREKGIIVNVGSGLGLSPTPLLTIYSATKAYVDYFTRSLAAEYTQKGITIQSLIPGFVHTKMIKSEKPSIFAPTPKSYVQSSLKTIGLETRTSAHWTHRLYKHGIELMTFFYPNLTLIANFHLFDGAKVQIEKKIINE